jgi:hypothetical protein
MAETRRGTHPLLAAVCLVPWAWLLCLGVFVALVSLKLGHFPTYSNPDPKHAGLSALYVLTIALLAATLFSPIVVGAAIALRALFGFGRLFSQRILWAYAAGIAASAAIIFGNAFGLMSWLLD